MRSRSYSFRMDASETEIIAQAKRLCKKRSKPFRTDIEVLEAATILFKLKEVLRCIDDVDRPGVIALERRVTRSLHERLSLSSQNVPVVSTIRENRLSRIDVEILLLLALSALGMVEQTNDVFEVQRAMRKSGKESLKVARALSQESRLVSSELVLLDYDEIMARSSVEIAGDFIAPFLSRRGSRNGHWSVRTYQELLDRLYNLVKLAGDRADLIYEKRSSRRSRQGMSGISSRINHLTRTLWHKVGQHPRWPLNKLRNAQLSREEKFIVLVLVGKELGFCSLHDQLFTGDGLSCCSSRDIPEIRSALEMLRSDRPLCKEGYIRVSGGADDHAATQDDETLRQCEFELTPEFAERLKIKRRRKSAQSARKPLVRPDQLVLSGKVNQALDMIAVQARHSKILLEDWGLAETIPYGNSLTVLFSGPPGVGKTACAEALAWRLKKPIIVANYAELENCWVGGTEKNIVRIFKDAADAQAVLFWDEADAMFYDRESAIRTWETRHVNVLLQELEKFKGLCILSTNRKITLDKALERRIALKVEFERPDKEMRRGIWRKLIPEKLPLARDVSVDKLSEEELTGGEIKNVVLNAARLALKRRRNASVRMQDFRRAMEIEKEGGWNETSRGTMGFRRN